MRVLRLTDEQYNKALLAIDTMENISVKRIEDYIKNDPNYILHDTIHKQLVQNYNDWGNLREQVQEADV